MNRVDRRAAYTLNVIKEAFLGLYKKKHIGKITVTEICKIAEINRATFYLHFHDPYDLLEKIENEYGEKMIETLQSTIEDDIEKLFDLSSIIHKTIRSDETLNLLANKQPSAANILQRLYDGLSAILTPRLQSRLGFSEEEAPAVFAFLFHGFHGVDMYLRQSGAKDPEKINHLIGKIVKNGIMR
jgi:AcrR family transcriptional regulator